MHTIFPAVSQIGLAAFWISLDLSFFVYKGGGGGTHTQIGRLSSHIPSIPKHQPISNPMAIHGEALVSSLPGE